MQYRMREIKIKNEKLKIKNEKLRIKNKEQCLKGIPGGIPFKYYF